MIVGLIAYGLAFGAVFLILKVIPDELSVLGGVIALALSGIMGLAAFAAAYAIKRRGLAAFGLRKASWKSLLLGAGLGVVCCVSGRGSASSSAQRSSLSLTESTPSCLLRSLSESSTEFCSTGPVRSGRESSSMPSTMPLRRSSPWFSLLCWADGG
ncbi:hypothetical protein [Brevibacterium sp. S22]|uniref:hypothetical protein n=1 Tax=Brevibacterium sp. S22 TaxID=2483794 RepID=UPI001F0EBF8A|nr:hypothetical protein [Brevibacterium sp. S22]